MRKKPSSSSTSSSPSSYATAAKPKRWYKKKRRVTPSEPTVAPAPIASLAAESYKAPITSPADSAKLRSTTADATSKVTAHDPFGSGGGRHPRSLAPADWEEDPRVHLPAAAREQLWPQVVHSNRAGASPCRGSGGIGQRCTSRLAWALEESGVTTEEDVPVLLGIQRGRWVSSLYTKVSHYRDLTTEGDQTNTN
jgi:hypothetical protein